MGSYNKTINFTSTYHYVKEIVDMYCAINKLKLAEQVKNTLILFIIYGVNKKTYELIIEKKIAPSLAIVNVYKTKLANNNIVIKTKKSEWVVCQDLQIKTNNFVFKLSLNKVGN
jgi:hypothetical protein